MSAQFEAIDKESINNLHFPGSDVLNDREAITQRHSELFRAQALGNLERSKTRIFFEDSQSKKVVETTVWAVTDNRVVLKKGVGIPINRIYRTT